MRIYTTRGDDGSTGLFLGGRVSKADAVVAVCGDVDEAVAQLGVARAACAQDDPGLAELLLELQRDLFVVGADLVTNPAHRDRREPGISAVDATMVDAVEVAIDAEVTVRPLRPVFIVPGATASSAALDLGRTVVRRAERAAVRLADSGHPVDPQVLRYLNRLSDLLFVLARRAAGDREEPPSHD